jgi:hypothetical protein
MAKRGPNKGEGGRPFKPIDWDTAIKLANLHCTGEEIASVINVNYDTFERAIRREYNQTFSEWFKSNSSTAKASLRRMMFEACKRGNVSMMIWLSKNWLGMRDQPEEVYENKPTIIKTKDGVEIKLGFAKDKESSNVGD